jgi:Concanavalin A-like lectin/glucanases superfamily/FG-GAP-like repeat
MKTNLFAVLLSLLPLAATAQSNGPGGAVLIDSAGSGNYVSIGTTSSLTGTFTLELWANPDRATNSSVLVGSGNHGFNFRLQQGTKIHGEIGNGTSWITTNADVAFPYSTNAWYHLAYVVTPTSYTIYANGTQVGAGSYVADNPVLYDDTTHSLYIGWSGLSLNQRSEYMNGEIDEVRMWNTARNASQIQTNMHRNLSGSEPGLMGYWRFDDCCCPTTADGTGDGFDGILSGSATQVISTAPIGTPAVSTLPATGVSAFSATLNGTATPNFEDSAAWFDYGLTTNYGNSTAITMIGATDAAPVAVSSLVSGLSPGTLYHYRLGATNNVGTNYGADATFETFVIDFTNISAGLTGVASGSALWGDFDNDGKLDVLLTGNGYADLWRNLGNGTFSNLQAGLPGVNQSAAALGDFDNDGKLDILLTGQSNGYVFTDIWRNLGNGVFTNNYFHFLPGSNNFGYALPPIYSGAVAVGDFDNDGKLDFLLTGLVPVGEVSIPISQVWRNLGNGTFTNIFSLPGVAYGSVALADFDNDGFLDILLTGTTSGSGSNLVSQVWRNLGNGTFSNINAGLPGVWYSSAAVGDFDNDGKLDILLSGSSYQAGIISQVWRNLGNHAFTNLSAGLPGMYDGSVAWGDFNNDGKLDILISGDNGSSVPLSQLWQNLGNSTFTNVNAGFPGLYASSVAWADYDNDGRLDILLTGASSGNAQSQVWRGVTPVANTAPTAPTSLSAVVTDNGVLLEWNAATDAQTPSSGLSYNIRVGTTSGGWDIVSPDSDSVSGYRRVARLGNAQERLFAMVTNLPLGRIFWSVQAVDTSFAGSPFAAEASFTVGQPVLFIRPAPPGQVVLQWPSWAANFALQSSASLVEPISWTTVTNVPIQVANWLLVTNNTLKATQFYRLRGP